MPRKEEKTTDDLQDAVDQAQEQGFVGVKVDPTPDEHYTVAGVTSGKPTPETDAEAKAEADAHAAEVSEAKDETD